MKLALTVTISNRIVVFYFEKNKLSNSVKQWFERVEGLVALGNYTE